MSEQLRILMLSADAAIRRAAEKAFGGGAVHVGDADDLAVHATAGFDCVLLDGRGEWATGLRKVRSAGIQAPVLLITDEEISEQAGEEAGLVTVVIRSGLSAEALRTVVRCAMRVHRAEIRAAEAEARLHSLVENLPFDCWARDADGLGIMQNEISRRTWGDFIGLPFEQQAVPREVLESWQRNNARVLAGEVLRAELQYPVDGELRTFYAVVAPIREGPAIRGLVGANIDITDFRRTEEALRESRALFEQFMNRSPAVVYLKDAEGRYVFVNETGTRVFGLERDRWVGRTAEEVWPAEMASQIDLADRQVLASGQPAETLQTIVHADGPHTWLVYRYPLTDGQGRRIVAGTAIDVTARQAMERRLRDAEERYRTLFEHSPHGVVVVDPADGSFVEFNGAAHRQLGYSREEFARLRVGDLDALETPEAAAAHMRRIMEHGWDEFETKQRDRAGEIRDMLVNVRRISVGGRTLLYSTQQDVTERNRLKQQLVQSQKMEAIGRLAGGVAHDFNNMLAVISGYAEALCRRLGEEHALHGHASEILKAAERGGALTQQLLAFGRRQIIKPQVMDLNRTVRELSGMLRRVIGPEIRIAIRVSDALAPVRADPGQMEQVVLNLALNARDAMPRGGTVSITTHNVDLAGRRAEMAGLPAGAYVRLAVNDTGVGMDAAMQARIFEPFFTTKKEGKGTGLGLAIVYSIVRQSGGTVSVRSEPGKGSAFEVYLPVAG